MKPNKDEYNECQSCGEQTQKNKCPICQSSHYLIKKKGKYNGSTTKFVL